MGKRRPYIVRQGDYVARLACQLGYGEDEIWDHPSNDRLRDAGRTKDILQPGDVLSVPDGPRRTSDVTLEAMNPLEGEVPKIRIQVVFEVDGVPRAGQPYTVEVEGYGAPVPGTSGADGLVAFDVPVTARRAVVVFQDPRAVYAVNVGHVDPVTEASGVYGRLGMLGYLPSGAKPDDLSDDHRRGVVGAFQADHGMTPNDTLDDATRALLTRVFGS